MTVCSVCGENLPTDRKVCDVCGTSVPSNPVSGPNQSGAAVTTSDRSPRPVDSPRTISSPVNRICCLCHAIYGSEHDDEFCRCGGELIAAPDIPVDPKRTESLRPSPVESNDTASHYFEPADDKQVPELGSGAFGVPPGPVRPPAGTDCLVVYSEQKTPIHYCPVDKDVTVIGRSDPVRGDFPDLDLGELFDQRTARKISRKHALVLRLRDSQSYLIRPLGGNTGTQIEREMAEPLRDYPLTIGTRMVLGGTVRLKFEKMT